MQVERFRAQVRRRRSRRIITTAALAVVGGGVLDAHALTYTWDNNTGTTGAQDGSGNWVASPVTTPTNWWNGANNGFPGSADTAVFGAGSGTAATVTINTAPVTVTGLVLNAPGSGTYTIARSATNTLSVTGSTTVNAFATISSPVTLGGTYTRTAGGLSLTGGNSGATVNVSGSLIDGILVGAVKNTNGTDFIAANSSGTAQPSNSVNNSWTSGQVINATANNGTAYTGTTAAVRLSGLRIVTLSGNTVINTGMITNTGGAFTGTFTGGTMTSGNGTDLIFLGGDSAYSTIVDSKIVDNGSTPIGVTVAQVGSVTFNGANEYTGGTALYRNAIVGNNQAFGTGTVTFRGGQLRSNTAVSLSNSIVLASNTTIAGAQNLTLGGNISGTGNLTISNTGITTLTGNNGFTGTLDVQNGATLALGSATAAGGTGFTQQSGGTITSSDLTARSITLTGFQSGISNGGLIFGRPGTGPLSVAYPTFGASAMKFTVNNDLTIQTNTPGLGPSSLIKEGAGTYALTGSTDFNFSNGVTINAGTLQMGNGGTTGSINASTGVSNAFTGLAGANLAFNRSNTLNVTTSIGGAINVVQKGAGTTTLGGTNTFSGNMAVEAGTLAFSSAAAISGNSTAKVSGGILSLGSNNPTLAGVQITGGTISGSGTLTSNTAFDVRAGAIDPGLAGTLGLAKTTSGTARLSGASSYGGGTSINGGTLLVNNIGGSGTGTGNVDVTAGTLGGLGFLSGTISLSGGAYLAPGDPLVASGVGTLTVGSLILAGASITDVEFGASPTLTSGHDLVNITGAFTAPSSLVSLNLFNAGTSDLFDTNGTYRLFDYATMTGTFDATKFTVTNGSPSKTYAFANDIGNTAVTVTIADVVVPEPASLGLLGVSAGGIGLRRRRRKS